MNGFSKITVGYVIQTFGKNDSGEFCCVEQEFVAGDICDYEDDDGNTIEPPDYVYQPYTMFVE